MPVWMDATFWAMIGLFIFLGIVVYMKVPGMLTRNLDDRAEKIRDELDQARKLREDAQQLLAEYQRRRREAEKEAEEIIEAAHHEALSFATEAKRKTEEFVERRTALAEQKIAQAEAQAVDDVRFRAVDVAIAAAEKIVVGKLDPTNADKLIKAGIDEVKARLN